MKFKFNNRVVMAFNLLLITFAFLALSSCSSYKKIPYFQDLDRSRQTFKDIGNSSSLTIQPDDQLSINVGSLNPEASAVFNNNLQNAGNNPTNPSYGYLVDKTGGIKLPLLGSMKVAGLTSAELSAVLQQQLLTYLKEPTVSVRIVNFKVAVLGDVLRPDMYTSAGERLTITEALALAGDLNITALRKDVLLVREKDGKREFIPIDLTSEKLFESPYFYLKNNDLLVIQPGKLKLAAVDTGYRNASLIISALSVVAITISFLR